MKLFVDCDDTLILWKGDPDPVSGLYPANAYDPNTKLISAIKKWWRLHDFDSIVVWSGGGEAYASRWAMKFLIWQEKGMMVKGYQFAISKDITLPTEEDICIDDQVLKVKGTLLTADEFIASVA